MKVMAHHFVRNGILLYAGQGYGQVCDARQVFRRNFMEARQYGFTGE
jgi:hypothetical protein